MLSHCIGLRPTARTNLNKLYVMLERSYGSVDETNEYYMDTNVDLHTNVVELLKMQLSNLSGILFKEVE